MTFFQFSIVVALLGNIAAGLMVYFSQARRRPNQFFMLLAAVLSAWLGSMLLGAMATTNELLELGIRLASATSALIPTAMCLLLLAVKYREESAAALLRRASKWIFSWFPVALLCRTEWFLRSAQVPDGTFTVGKPHYGPGYPFFAAYLIGSLSLLVYRSFREERSTAGIQRTEIQFLWLACSVSLFLGVTLQIVPMMLGFPELARFLPLSVVVFVGIMAYGISTRRIMDVPHVLRGITAYTLLTTYLVLMYWAVWSLATWTDRHALLPDLGLPIPGLLAALAVAFSLAPANGVMQRVATRLFLNRNTLDLGRVMQQASPIFTSISTLDELLRQFAQITGKILGADPVIVLLPEGSCWTQRQPPPATNGGLRLEAGDAVIQMLQIEREPLCVDVIQRMPPSPLRMEAARWMAGAGMVVAAGAHVQDRLTAVVLLGPRFSGRIYGLIEQRAVQLLCANLTVATENATLYTQVQDSMVYNNILLDNLVSGVAAADVKRRITVFNREAQRITGLASEQVLGRPLSILPPPLARALENTFASGEGTRDQEAVIARGGGQDIVVRLGSASLHGHTGQALGALLVFHDLTAVRELERQVRRTDRLASVGTLSAGMAHEIKNPLVALKTFAQLLPERYDDPDFRNTFSDLVGREITRIDSIVNQLLHFARPAKPTLSPIHVHHVIEDTLKLMQEQIRRRGLTLVRRMESPNDLILGDGNMLAQAFLNLLLNAVEAMSANGLLTVATRFVPGHNGDNGTAHRIEVDIADTGAGIAPEELPHIFDPFYTTKSGGTGLGLSVAHGIVTEHGGVIDVQSVEPSGTVFSVRLPLLNGESAP